MDSTVTVLVPPASEPVTVGQARHHCRIDGEEDDELLDGLITAARQWVEGYLARALLTQTLQWTVSDRAPHGSWPLLPAALMFAPGIAGWPSRLMHPLELPRAPVQTIDSVTVREMDDTDTPLDPSQWSVDTDLQPARLRIQPQIVGGAIRHVQVVFVAGYVAPPAIQASPRPEPPPRAPIPKGIIQAILLLVAFLYENRGDAGGDMPMAAQWLLDPHRIAFFGG